jgi:Protein of unknown function (DUF2380)
MVQKRSSMTIRILIVLLAMVSASVAEAAQKAAVFPFILVSPMKEEDFFTGAKGPSPAEQARLTLIHDEFAKLIAATGTYESIDLTPLAADIEAKMPLHECNGCELDLSKRAGAEVAFIVVVEKASDTVLNMSVSEIDVAKEGVKRTMMAVIQGNTDDAWLGGVRWMVRNRVLKPQPAKEAAP